MNMLEKISSLAGKYFSFLVIAAAVIAFLLPEGFLFLGSYITILLGIVMFGMGLTLEPVDFQLVFKNPLPVIIGVIAQFVVMPLTALAIAYVLQLPNELAAGLVLLGSVPGGTASNVMVYLARGNLPLSIAMTSFSTILAPICTPFILLGLANQWMPINALDMVLDIVYVIIVPIVLGLIIRRIMPVIVNKSIRVVPLISVAAIIIIVTAVVAGNVDTLAVAGVVLFFAVLLHNAAGLLLGYVLGKIVRLKESDCRAISIEVGMQNSGLGVALATAHLGGMAAVPSAIAAVWHNISGPILATFWSKRQVDDEENTDKLQPKTKSL
ncbi:MAG TPA: bile acid:sodium symporter family protein [Pseudogracilibacillus sp.]|nr:bile acid:sodium symporter family protein [Pseudogracilibacillus sp.]